MVASKSIPSLTRENNIQAQLYTIFPLHMLLSFKLAMPSLTINISDDSYSTVAL